MPFNPFALKYNRASFRQVEQLILRASPPGDKAGRRTELAERLACHAPHCECDCPTSGQRIVSFAKHRRRGLCVADGPGQCFFTRADRAFRASRCEAVSIIYRSALNRGAGCRTGRPAGPYTIWVLIQRLTNWKPHHQNARRDEAPVLDAQFHMQLSSEPKRHHASI